MSETLKGLHLMIFRSSMPDCSFDGISSRCKEVTLVGEGIAPIFDATEECPAIKLVRRIIGGLPYVHAELVETPKGMENRWLMFGGTYVATSDSRFSEAVRKLGWQGPVPLHDRYEPYPR